MDLLCNKPKFLLAQQTQGDLKLTFPTFPNSRVNLKRSQCLNWQRMLGYRIHCTPIPVTKTGFSLCSISNREKRVFNNWEPCNENRFFPMWKYYTGKTLFWPCTGPVRDCRLQCRLIGANIQLIFKRIL